MARITHHDLRHFFATICIESGVDVPTIADIEHKGGGALAMKNGKHLRDEHIACRRRERSTSRGLPVSGAARRGSVRRYSLTPSLERPDS